MGSKKHNKPCFGEVFDGIEFELEFYGPVNTIKVMLSQSVYLITLLQGRLSMPPANYTVIYEDT